tara:strand:- start:2134 stop:2346 length:213 start_codon:yes stop_codon:yes gene_type:complete
MSERGAILVTIARQDRAGGLKHDYNHHRPHSAHGGVPPVEFAEKAGMGHAPYRLEQPARTGQHFETGLSL